LWGELVLGEGVVGASEVKGADTMRMGVAGSLRAERSDSFLLYAGQTESRFHLYFLLFSFSARSRWGRDLYEGLASGR